MAADGKNPGGLRAWINDHRRMQVKNWPLGGQTTWEVEVVEPGDYAFNVLFSHSVKMPLKVTVTAGAVRCEGNSEYVAHHGWWRFSLPGTLRLAHGKHTLGLTIASADGGSKEILELLSIELVRPAVQARRHRAALAMRAKADTQWFRQARFGLMCHWTSQTVPRSGPPKPDADAARDFDVAKFTEPVAQTGAHFVCFNPWVLPPPTEFQDYFAGEGNGDPTVQGGLKPGDHGRISGGADAGLQASAALIMEGDWGHNKRDTEIGPPHQTAAPTF